MMIRKKKLKIQRLKDFIKGFIWFIKQCYLNFQVQEKYGK